MKSLNICAISGNLTKDPELRATNSGVTIATLSVAVNDREKVNGEWSDRPSYFDVTVFGTTAENCAKYLAKGSHVEVQGKLRQERWEKDGEKRYAVKIIADSVVFPPKSQSGNASVTPQDFAAAGIPVTAEDDGIPW